MRQYATKPARLLKRPSNRVLIDLGDEDPLRPLDRSLLVRPICPVLVTPDLETSGGSDAAGAHTPSINPCPPSRRE